MSRCKSLPVMNDAVRAAWRDRNNIHEEAIVKGNMTGSDVTKVPKRKLVHECPRGSSPWPLKADDTPPLAWWRTLPSDAFGNAERLILLATLESIDVLHGGDDCAAAMKGDPAAAIGFAFSLMPINDMTLQVDIAMTALLRCALERNAAAALVLAQVTGLTDLGHPYAIEIAGSWLVHGRCSSDNPRKFGEAETVLLTAFRERHRYDGDA
jgi:hypothetical protein